MNAIWKAVSESRQLDLPEEARPVLDVEHGGRVMIEALETSVRLFSVADKVAQAQAMARELLKDHPGFSADTFLAERKGLWGE